MGNEVLEAATGRIFEILGPIEEENVIVAGTVETAVSALLCATVSRGMADFKIANPTEDNRNDSVPIGVFLDATTMGGTTRVLRSGILEDNVAFSSFSPGDTLFCNANGSITNVVPDVANQFKVATIIGRALSNRRLIIDINRPVRFTN